MNINTPIENLSERLNYALELTKMKKADLARAINVKPQVIQFLCNSQTQSSRFTFEIATALGLNVEWLATGEGTMFIADDPNKQFLNVYKKAPLLDFDNLKRFFLEETSIDKEKVTNWLPLMTEDQDIITMQISDMSMDPYLPIHSYVFIKKAKPDECKNYKYVLAYSFKFNTFLIRSLMINDFKQVLLPANKELYKEVEMTDEVILLGIVTDCFWHIKS